MIKLLQKIDKFINPKKYKLDNISKTINKLKLGDILYVMYIPHGAIELYKCIYESTIQNKLKEIKIMTSKVIYANYERRKFKKDILKFIEIDFKRNEANDMLNGLTYAYYDDKIITIPIEINQTPQQGKTIILNNRYKGNIYITTDKKIIKQQFQTFIQTYKNMRKEINMNTKEIMNCDNIFKQKTREIIHKINVL